MASAQQENPANGRTEDFSTSQQHAPNGVEAPSHAPVVENGARSPPEAAEAGGDQKPGPSGGFDSTPIPRPAPGVVGYTLKFTFHRAINLSIGDAHVMSSDPFVFAQLNTSLPQRHKEDPNLRFRSPTVRRSTDPHWEEEWIVANVPSTGFKLKVRIYDEDPADHDDMLGKVHINVDSLSDNWTGIRNQGYRLTLRDSSKRALSLRAVARTLRIVEHMRGELFMSIEMLGRTGEDHQNGRVYTVGPVRWCRHYSPILGRITHTTDTGEHASPPASADGKEKKAIKRYNFQANEIQLEGPVPAELYHRFVEFKPWVGRMFTKAGFQGVVLGKALHHQHTRVYNHDRRTVWGHFPDGPSVELTKKFLDLVHYDQGGRIFTYVLTLDAMWRFTETGKEFGIDMLSKHTMHSDVSIYIAFSGEFFIQRRKQQRPRLQSPNSARSRTSSHSPHQHHHSHEHEHESAPHTEEQQPPTDPSHYTLYIDNDSGTYRPNAQLLPLLAAYLSQNLPGLHISTLDCQADAELQTKLKNEQRERKKREGDNLVYAQGDDSSISSSEDERLDAVEAGYDKDGHPLVPHVSTGDGSKMEHGAVEQLARTAKFQGKSHLTKLQRSYGGMPKDGGDQEGVDEA